MEEKYSYYFWKADEYLEYLESEGVDTVCFMGYGFDFEDYRVGQEFYMSYAFFARRAKLDKITVGELKIAFRGYNMSDRYRLTQKYEFKTAFSGNIFRAEKCIVQNLRTKESFRFSEEQIVDILTPLNKDAIAGES